MSAPSLEDALRRAGGAVRLLRGNAADHLPFPYPPEWSTWADEQWAWRNTAVLFDQTTHQDDTRFSGPDVRRLLSEFGVNTPTNLGANRAKQFVAVGSYGNYIGDAIMFGLDDNTFQLVGVPMAANWLEFQVLRGGYDVEVDRVPALAFNRVGGMKLWRYQINGPATQQIIDAVAGTNTPHIPFFKMGSFEIAGTPVRALNHTMSGVPGDDYTGLELFGPIEHAQTVLDALMRAGAEFGLQRAGASAYLSTDIESGGWIPLPLPAIYSQPEMKSYREHLPFWSVEAAVPVEGSFASERIEDYYFTPWDLGYGHLVRFDHDFVGRDALEQRQSEPHRRRVWLRWNEDDVARVIRTSLFGADGERPRIISLPTTVPMGAEYDEVRDADGLVGISTIAGYTVNTGAYASLAIIDESKAVDGAQVEVVWGDPSSGKRARSHPQHVMTTIRATVSTTPLHRR